MGITDTIIIAVICYVVGIFAGLAIGQIKKGGSDDTERTC